MGTLEATVSMLETLPENELHTIFEVTKSFFVNCTSDNPFRPMTEDEFITGLDLAKANADQGLYSEAMDVSKELRDKYGL